MHASVQYPSVRDCLPWSRLCTPTQTAHTPASSRVMMWSRIVDLSEIYENITCFDEPETVEEALYKQGVVLQRGWHRVDELQRVREREVIRWGPHFRGWGDEHAYVSEVQQEASGTAVQAHWITDIGEHNRVSSPYVAEDSLVEYLYGTAALLVQVPALGEGIRAAVRA